MFKNKVVIITGASQGIGREVASQYAEAGARVVLADINEALGNALCSELVETGLSAIFVPTDVRKEQDIINLMKITVQQFGSIHVLINNAGIFRRLSPYDISVDEWDDVINTNLRSVFYAQEKLLNLCG